MKMKVINITDEDGCGRDEIQIELDGKLVFTMRGAPDCPEDFTLSRDLSDALKVPHLIKLAHEAGKRGEPLAVIEETISE